MLSQHELIERFKDGATSGRASNLFIDGDVAYSYGRHFPLAVRRDWGAEIAYLINGDHYSNTTTQHQGHCISRLRPNVQVPFSALDAAQLTDPALPKDALRIVAHRGDRHYDTCAHCGRDAAYSGSLHAYCHTDDGSPLCPEAEERLTAHHLLGAVLMEYRGRYFLSSIDDQESWRALAYFLCELPHAVVSIEEAFASLVPDAVTEACAAGRDVRRQGDVFVIASDLPTCKIPGPTVMHAAILQTSHVATEARVNGTVFVRGSLRHEPPNRPSQHARLVLGKTWWIAVKNSAVASWNAVGGVD